MISHELARELKDAGFPQREPEQYTSEGEWIPEDERRYIPTLEELIEACGKQFDSLKRGYKEFEWTFNAFGLDPIKYGHSDTSWSEAVARLWLDLHANGDASA